MMKILVSEDGPFLKYGFTEALQNYGIDVRHTQLYKSINEGSMLPFIEEIKEYKPDLFLNPGTTIKKNFNKVIFCLNKLNVPYVYWAIDDPIEFFTYSIENGKNAALLLTPAVECIPFYKKLGINVSFAPFACNKRYHYKGKYNPKYDYDIIFIGNNYKYDQRTKGIYKILNPLIERNYNIKVFGCNWFEEGYPYVLPDEKFYGGYCYYNEVPDACATAKIVLGIHSVTNSKTMMSMRTFEVLGCQGFYLSQYAKALEYNFTNGVHLVWSDDAETTLRLVDTYLKDAESRDKIAKLGQKRCYANYNYDNMVDRFVKELYKYKVVK